MCELRCFAKEVLTKKELERYERAKTTFDKPVIITTQEEAIKKENNPNSFFLGFNFIKNVFKLCSKNIQKFVL